MSSNIFESAAKVKAFFLKSFDTSTVVQLQKVLIIDKESGVILKVPSIKAAVDLIENAEIGFIFKCSYKNGCTEIEPVI